ncbi:MAG: hypothetical protein WCY32_02530 [Burkholderiaceae bacterium]
MLCAAGLFCTVAQAAIVFDFSWTGNPAQDPNLTSSGDTTASVSGFIELDVGPGDSFDKNDVLSASFTLSSSLFEDVVFGHTNISFLTGTVAADGLSAGLTDFYLGDGSPPSFGCVSLAGDCARTALDRHISSYTTAPDTDVSFLYTTTEAARASFHLTAADPVPVSLPGTAALALASLAAMTVVRRRRPSAGG